MSEDTGLVVLTAPTFVSPQDATEIENLMARAKAIVVTNDEEFNQVGELIADAGSMRKKIEGKRKEEKEPYSTMAKAIDDYARKFSAPLKDAEAKAKQKANAYAAEKERIRVEQIEAARREREEAERKSRAIEEANAKKIAEAKQAQEDSGTAFGAPPAETIIEAREAAPMPVEITSKATAASATVTWITKYEITGALSEVPAKFLMVNEKAVRAAVRAGLFPCGPAGRAMEHDGWLRTWGEASTRSKGR